MVVKDRLKQFKVIYEQKHEQDEDMEYMMQIESVIEKKYLLPRTEDFLSKVTNIQQRLELAKSLMIELQKKQSEILTAVEDTKLLNEERDQLMETVKETTSYIHADIKILEKTAQNDNFGNTIEDRIKSSQVNVLLLSFREVMSEYNKMQMTHRDRCKSRIRRQLNICGSEKTAEEIEKMIEDGTTNVFQTQLSTDATIEAMKDVEARHVEILKLEQSITELFEIFQDVANMVEIQGDMIDNIERHVEATVDSVAVSKTAINRAYKYKRRKLMTLCCPCVALYRSCVIL